MNTPSARSTPAFAVGGQGGAGAAEAAPAPVTSGRGFLDGLRTVGLFIPKRLAWRLREAVDFQIRDYEANEPATADEWLQKEAMIELKKALERAGYTGPV